MIDASDTIQRHSIRFFHTVLPVDKALRLQNSTARSSKFTMASCSHMKILTQLYRYFVSLMAFLSLEH
jgi:hypothetical protein